MPSATRALLNGDHTPLEIAKLLRDVYGATDINIEVHPAYAGEGYYSLHFNEAMTPEIKALRPSQRRPHLVRRNMQFAHLDALLSDYKDLTGDAPMTFLALGDFGQERAILASLLAIFGGFIRGEYDEAWTPVEASPVAAAA